MQKWTRSADRKEARHRQSPLARLRSQQIVGRNRPAVEIPTAIEQGAVIARGLGPDAFEQRRVALYIGWGRHPAVAQLHVEMPKKKLAPCFVDRFEPS